MIGFFSQSFIFAYLLVFLILFYLLLKLFFIMPAFNIYMTPLSKDFLPPFFTALFLAVCLWLFFHSAKYLRRSIRDVQPFTQVIIDPQVYIHPTFDTQQQLIDMYGRICAYDAIVSPRQLMEWDEFLAACEVTPFQFSLLPRGQ